MILRVSLKVYERTHQIHCYWKYTCRILPKPRAGYSVRLVSGRNCWVNRSLLLQCRTGAPSGAVGKGFHLANFTRLYSGVVSVTTLNGSLQAFCKRRDYACRNDKLYQTSTGYTGRLLKTEVKSPFDVDLLCKCLLVSTRLAASS